jgi:carboxyl-terminal processing protease
MHAVVKHLSIFAGVGALTWGAYHLVAKADTGSPQVDHERAAEMGLSTLPTTSGYDFASLQLLNRTMYFVEEKYVDPSRVHHDEMFDSALESVERRVPEVLFRREPGGDLLHVAVGGYSTTLQIPPIESSRDLTVQLQRVADVLQLHLSGEVPLPEVEYALVNGVLSTLDPHSVLLPPAVSEEMEVENSGEFGGLGITITLRDGRLTVEYPLEDTPAYKVGLQPDDKIVRIDGESTINMDLQEAVGKLRGAVGSTVLIHVMREGWTDPKPFTIRRDRIKINPVKAQLMEGGVGYVRISNFHALVSGDLSAALNGFRRDNGNKEIRGLVLDLRGNPGGYLHQAVQVSDLFLSSGQIVSTVERNNRSVDEERASRVNTEGDYPIVVLVSANSASASEIVAGALKNQGRAVIVGERTFGKGSVQNLLENPGVDGGSTLKLTVAKYLTPGEKSIQSVGIPPDILVEPTIVKDDEEHGHQIAMYARERVTRESDLDHNLEQMDAIGEPPVYSLRYLFEVEEADDGPRSDRLDLSDDWEVQFGRDLVLASPESANRAEVLSSVGSVVSTHTRAQRDAIAASLESAGLSWRPGPQPSQPQLSVEWDLGPDGVLTAGEDNAETIQVRVTNEGGEAVHQVMAVSSSSLDFLDGNEFFFGKLEPGETRSWSAPVKLVEGYRDELGQVELRLLDAERRELDVSTQMVRTVGMELPSLQWDYELLDGGEAGRGDGDGVAEPGETVALRLKVTNVGLGATKDAFAKLKNRSGKDLDLKVGVLELGVIEPGATISQDFEFQVKGSEPELTVELILGDQAKYDYAAVWRGGFYDFFTQTEELAIPVGTAPSWDTRRPPSLEVSRQPALVVSDRDVVVSGVARDDSGLRDVIVYHKAEDHESKVFYEGGAEGVTTMPFTVDARLEEGWNVFVVLVRDHQGLTDIRSVNVWYDTSGLVQLSEAELSVGG